LLLLLELPQLLLPVLLQQLLELGSLCLPLLLTFFLLRLLLPLLQLLPRLLLVLLLLPLPLLLDGVETNGLRRPLRNGISLDLLVHRAGVLRRPVAAGPVTYCHRIPLDPRSGRFGGSLLLLGARRLGPFRQRRGRLTHQWTGRGALGTSRRPRVGGACEHSKAKSQSS